MFQNHVEELVKTNTQAVVSLFFQEPVHTEMLMYQLGEKVKVKVAQSCPTLCDSLQSMGFSRPKYWSG